MTKFGVMVIERQSETQGSMDPEAPRYPSQGPGLKISNVHFKYT